MPKPPSLPPTKTANIACATHRVSVDDNNHCYMCDDTLWNRLLAALLKARKSNVWTKLWRFFANQP